MQCSTNGAVPRKESHSLFHFYFNLVNTNYCHYIRVAVKNEKGIKLLFCWKNYIFTKYRVMQIEKALISDRLYRHSAHCSGKSWKVREFQFCLWKSWKVLEFFSFLEFVLECPGKKYSAREKYFLLKSLTIRYLILLLVNVSKSISPMY